MHRPRAEALVDLAAVRHNVDVLRAAAPGAALMAVVKADGLRARRRPRRPGRARRRAPPGWASARSTRPSSCAPRASTAPVLSWLHLPDDDFAAAVAADVDLSVASRAHLAAVLDGRAAGRAARPAAPQDRHRAHPQRRAAPPTGRTCSTSRPRPRPTARRRSWRSGRTWRTPTSPTTPRSTVQAARLDEAWRAARDRGLDPIRHLANSAATLTRPDLHFDLVRPGIAVYGLDPLGRPVPAEPAAPGDDVPAPASRWPSGCRGRGRLLRPRLDDRHGRRRSRSSPSGTPTACRAP